jgi:hypothetical protein
MTFEKQYFRLARGEERSGNFGAALLLYLSSFCSACNSGSLYPCGSVAKIRKMQLALNLPDGQLQGMVRSYGPLSDQDCRLLLERSIRGDAAGIRAMLSKQ